MPITRKYIDPVEGVNDRHRLGRFKYLPMLGYCTGFVRVSHDLSTGKIWFPVTDIRGIGRIYASYARIEELVDKENIDKNVPFFDSQREYLVGISPEGTRRLYEHFNRKIQLRWIETSVAWYLKNYADTGKPEWSVFDQFDWRLTKYILASQPIMAVDYARTLSRYTGKTYQASQLADMLGIRYSRSRYFITAEQQLKLLRRLAS